MQNLLLAAEVVVPLLVLLAVGALVRACGIVDAVTLTRVNRLIVYVALPSKCLLSLSESDLSRLSESAPVMLFIAAGILLVFLAAELIVPRLCSVPARRGVLVQALTRGNDAVFGYAVASSLLPALEEQQYLLSMAVSTPLFNTLGVLTLELNRGDRVRFWPLVKKVATNPLSLGCIAGLLLNVLGVRLPRVLASPLQSLSELTTPLAFIVLGSQLRFSSLYSNRKALAALSFAKLALVPAIVLAVAMLLGFSGARLVCIFAIFTAPVALASFPLACEYGGDEHLAGELVAVTSVLAIVTVFFFIFTMKQIGGF